MREVRAGPASGGTGRVGMNLAYGIGGTVRQVVFDYVSDEVSTASVDFWYVDEGNAVEKGDELVELRTEDGGLLTVTAPAAGILRERFYEQGDQLEVGDVIATIEDGLGDLVDEDEEKKTDKAHPQVEDTGDDEDL